MSFKRITVLKRDNYGNNILFIDNRLKRKMTKKTFIEKIKRGEYPDYYVAKSNKGNLHPRKKPNGKRGSNLSPKKNKEI